MKPKVILSFTKLNIYCKLVERMCKGVITYRIILYGGPITGPSVQDFRDYLDACTVFRSHLITYMF